MADPKEELHRTLRASRAVLLSKLDGLSEYDLRRPMTATGTNLLGLVKHLAGLEYGYLGDALGRPAAQTLPWIDDGSIWQGGDMWARPQETSEYITDLYQRPAPTPTPSSPNSTSRHQERSRTGRRKRDTTLGVLLIRMVAETAQHAGHADIVRELIDGRGGPDQDAIDEHTWQDYAARVQAAADMFATGRHATPPRP